MGSIICILLGFFSKEVPHEKDTVLSEKSICHKCSEMSECNIANLCNSKEILSCGYFIKKRPDAIEADKRTMKIIKS